MQTLSFAGLRECREAFLGTTNPKGDLKFDILIVVMEAMFLQRTLTPVIEEIFANLFDDTSNHRLLKEVMRKPLKEQRRQALVPALLLAVKCAVLWLLTSNTPLSHTDPTPDGEVLYDYIACCLKHHPKFKHFKKDFDDSLPFPFCYVNKLVVDMTKHVILLFYYENGSDLMIYMHQDGPRSYFPEVFLQREGMSATMRTALLMLVEKTNIGAVTDALVFVEINTVLPHRTVVAARVDASHAANFTQPSTSGKFVKAPAKLRERSQQPGQLFANFYFSGEEKTLRSAETYMNQGIFAAKGVRFQASGQNTVAVERDVSLASFGAQMITVTRLQLLVAFTLPSETTCRIVIVPYGSSAKQTWSTLESGGDFPPAARVQLASTLKKDGDKQTICFVFIADTDSWSEGTVLDLTALRDTWTEPINQAIDKADGMQRSEFAPQVQSLLALFEFIRDNKSDLLSSSSSQ
jgi:hypothetical protein